MPQRRALLLVVIALGAIAGACSNGSSSGSAPSSKLTDGASPRRTVWLCRPGMPLDPCAGSRIATVENGDGSTSTRTSLAAAKPPVDCFYVYPTVSTQSTPNADLTIEWAEAAVAATQASPFSQVCRVWAPLYRQQTLSELARAGVNGDPRGAAIAYADVLAAWRDYLAHDNNGRPVVFIGHSQGAAILIRLLASEIDPVPARRAQMVSAILLGGNVQVPTGRDVGGSFRHIPACRSATQRHCVIAYSAFDGQPHGSALFGRPGHGISLLSNQRIASGQEVLCTNPAALGGGIGILDPYFIGVGRAINGTPIPTPWVTYPNMYSAQCRTGNGATWLQVTFIGGDADPRPKLAPQPGGSYHDDDVNLALGNLVALVAQQERAGQ